MSSLRQVQALLCSAVFENSGSALEELGRFIAPRPGLSPEDHVKIYRRGVLTKLVEALRDIYPVCRKLVGDAFFHAMAQTYVRQTPSRSPDLGEFGHDFGAFIGGFQPANALPYLPDVARLEWCWHRVFHAESSEPLDPRALAKVTSDQQGRIRFRLAAATALLESNYPVHRIWQVNQSDFDGDGEVDLGEGGTRLLVWRRGYEMRIDPLDEETWPVLTSFWDGKDFATACRNLTDQAPDADMAAVLPLLVQRGWIASFTL